MLNAHFTPLITDENRRSGSSEVRRAAYLYETGRLDELKAEGLEHFVTSPRPAPGGQVILVNGEVAYHSARPGNKSEQLDAFYRRWKRIQLKTKRRLRRSEKGK